MKIRSYGKGERGVWDWDTGVKAGRGREKEESGGVWGGRGE